MVGKDVHRGFSIPIPKENIPKMKEAMVQPCGIAIEHWQSTAD
ncbi:MAG: hypothetical protein ACI90V_013254, partial [Bacillariaceae sp.]